MRLPGDAESEIPDPDSLGATKTRLLLAAEGLFAQHGFEGTSLRAVARVAGVGLSAANYHFGSKKALIHEAVSRRIVPLNARRLAFLEEQVGASSGTAPSVEAIVESFFRPAFEEIRSIAEIPARYGQLAGRIYSDPHEAIASLRLEIFRPVAERYLEVLGDALPQHDANALQLGYQFMVGILVHTLTGQLPLEQIDGFESREAQSHWLLDEMVAFVAAGLRSGRVRSARFADKPR